MSRYFRSSYSIGIEEYKYDEELDKIIPTRINNFLEEFDRHWIQHIENYDTINKYHREENHGEYANNMELFNMSEVLGRLRLIEDGNESLLTMGIQKNYGDTHTIEGSTLVIDQIEVSTFTADSLKHLLSIALQKTGIVRTFPRVMVYTSKKYQGLGVKNYWYNQQLKHLHMLIMETSNKKPT